MAYDSFAQVYDELMDNVPYEEWGIFIQEELKRYGIWDGLMLELGCGTGKMMGIMADSGFDMIGVDNSEWMLDLAMENFAGDDRMLFLLQDMREFELYGTVRSVISVCDSVNYILDPEELIRVFALVNNYLDPNGIFIFDFNTEHKYRDEMGDMTIAEDRDDVSFIWYNEYDETEHVNYIDLTLFLKEEGDLFRKHTEEHIQRGYTLPEMKAMIEASGMVFLDAYDGYRHEKADENSQRIVIVAKENGKGDR